MAHLLQINNLWGGYHKETIIKDVYLDINAGEFIGVIGPNGSGKTTLLRLASRVLKPHRGRINLNGRDIAEMDLKEFCRKVAFVPQDTLVNFSFSVWEMVLMGRIPHLTRLQLETLKDFSIAESAMIMTATLGLRDKRMDELSAGERQQVVIAKALAQEPVLLFLDEPTAHLDIGHQVQILDLLRKLNRKNNLTIVMVVHDLNLASEYCSRIVLLNEGKVYKDGLPQQVLTYQNIEAVYKTLVVVRDSPINSKPYVILIPREK